MGEFFEKFDRIPMSQKILLMLLVFAAFGVAFYMFAYSPLENETLTSKLEIEEQSRRLSQHRGLEETRNDLRMRVEESGLISNRTVSLPETPQIAELYRIIEETVSEVSESPNGPLEIYDFHRDPFQEAIDYRRIPLQLTMAGTYDQALEFSWRLAGMSRIVHVRAVDLAISDGSRGVPGSPQLNIIMNVEAFYRPES
jgi:Tfp pilus assembly protein PilO